MSKYRLLTEEELTEFHDEFVKYLVMNGITADQWEEMKKSDPDTAGKILNLFSDVVLEGVLRQIRFMDFRSKSYIQSVQCLEDKVFMVALTSDHPELDLREEFNPSDYEEFFSIHKSERPYSGNREQDIFELTTKGYEPSDGTIFKALMVNSVE